MIFSIRNIPLSFRGAALIEYGILLGLVAVVAVSSVSGLGNKVYGTFSETTDVLSNRVSSVQNNADVDEIPSPPPIQRFSMTTGSANYDNWRGLNGLSIADPESTGVLGGTTSPLTATLATFSMSKSDPSEGIIGFVDPPVDEMLPTGGFCDNGTQITLAGGWRTSNGELYNNGLATGPFFEVGEELNCALTFE